jgi:hypothetical protein
MYSHGSSVRIGVGKRGHGGRNYRPPSDNNKKRGDDSNKLIPPPLKIQLDVPEYAEITSSSSSVSASSSDHNDPSSGTGGLPPRRLHLCLEGSTLDERRKSVREIEKKLRSEFGVHLVIPGRNQRGPLAVVGLSHRETIPAIAYLMKRLIFDDPSTNSSSNAATTATTSVAAGTNNNNTSSSIVFFLTGRIQKNVKDPNDVILSGRFFQYHRLSQQQQIDAATQFLLSPYWLFESASWNVMACPLTSPTIQQPSQQHQNQHQQSASSMMPLSTVSGDGNSSSMTQSSSSTSSSSSMTKQEETSTMILEALQMCVDNLRFRLGNLALSELDIFLHPTPPSLRSPESAFATGNSPTRAPNNHQLQHPAPILAIFEEIREVRVTLPDGVAITIL